MQQDSLVSPPFKQPSTAAALSRTQTTQSFTLKRGKLTPLASDTPKRSRSNSPAHAWSIGKPPAEFAAGVPPPPLPR